MKTVVFKPETANRILDAAARAETSEIIGAYGPARKRRLPPSTLKPMPFDFVSMTKDDPFTKYTVTIRPGGFFYEDEDGELKFHQTGWRGWFYPNDVNVFSLDLDYAEVIDLMEDGTKQLWACLDLDPLAFDPIVFFTEPQVGLYCKLIGKISDGVFEQYHRGMVDTRGSGSFGVRGSPSLFGAVIARAYWIDAAEGEHAADELVPPETAHDGNTMYLHPTWDFGRVMA